MLSNEEISERNGLLIDFITALDLGIHIVDLPHKPKFLSSDYTMQFSAQVKNFHLVLMCGSKSDGMFNDEVFLDIRLKPLKNMDMEYLKVNILEWLVKFNHTRVYTLKLADTDLFICGFNHRNKIDKTNPYPVFAKIEPLHYYKLEQVENTKERFGEYDLIIN